MGPAKDQVGTGSAGILRPATPLGQRQRLLGQPDTFSQPACPGHRGQLAQEAHHQTVLCRTPGRGQPLFEMAGGGLQRSGPELGGAQVQQCQRPQVVGTDQVPFRWEQVPGRDHGRVQIAPQPRPVQADGGQGDRIAVAASLR